tara:strand:+ start:122 stop:343 length:222 start_codon:yes stop_codon:yes gene_type:complete
MAPFACGAKSPVVSRISRPSNVIDLFCPSTFVIYVFYTAFILTFNRDNLRTFLKLNLKFLKESLIFEEIKLLI